MLNNFIHSQTKNSSTSVEYFCIKEHSDFIDSDGNAQNASEKQETLAKKINKDNHIIYMIKVSTSNYLFNPFSKLDRERSYSFLDNVIKPIDKYTNVNEKVFIYYLKFLSTSNIIWLNKAERERL